jgi:uncharacterized protein (DUF1330 family)
MTRKPSRAWENYRTRAARVIADFGGRYLVRGARAAASNDE